MTFKMNIPPLKSCPFCGGEAELRIGEHSFTDAKVVCVGCSAEGPIFDTECDSPIMDAIAHWNTRMIE